MALLRWMWNPFCKRSIVSSKIDPCELQPEVARNKLKKAQQSWIRFRDNVCVFEATGYTGAQGSRTVIEKYKAGYTEIGTAQLQRLIGYGGNFECPVNAYLCQKIFGVDAPGASWPARH